LKNIFTIAKNDRYNPSLALLRTLLAMYVVLFHLIPRYAFYGHDVQVPLMLEFGLLRLLQSSAETNPAVLAFITLSGYCIHRNGLRHSDYNVRAFVLRRAFRIMPLLVIGTLLGWLVFAALNDDLRIIAITNTANISLSAAIYKLSGLFAFIPYQFEQLLHQANSPLITCIVELWLYAFYILAMPLMQRMGQKLFMVLLLAITVLGAIAYNLWPAITSWWHNGSFFGFVLYWWLGALAVDPGNKLFKPLIAYLLAFIALTVVLTMWPNILLLVEIRKILLALLVAILLRKTETLNLRGVNYSMFNASFSLYALHMPLICLALYFGLNLYVALLLIMLVAYISYVCIERPLINWGQDRTTANYINVVY